MAAPHSQTSAYTQGHSASVVASHSSRTVENSAAFVLPHLQPNYTIVDLGCGPGTITRGFTSFVPQGKVIGIDASDAVIEQARTQAAGNGDASNLEYRVADITTTLPFDDGTVDVVFTHQTLCHIPSPVPVMQEALRVLKPGGLLAVREYDHMSWHPSLPGVEAYTAGMNGAIAASGAQGAGSGRRLHSWAAQAGFDPGKMRVGAGTTCHVMAEAKWWADVSVGRLEGEIGERWLERGIVESQDEIDVMKNDLKSWGETDGAWYTSVHGEVLAWK